MSIYLSFYLFIYLSIYLYISIYIYMSTSLFLCRTFSLSRARALSLSLSLSLSTACYFSPHREGWIASHVNKCTHFRNMHRGQNQGKNSTPPESSHCGRGFKFLILDSACSFLGRYYSGSQDLGSTPVFEARPREPAHPPAEPTPHPPPLPQSPAMQAHAPPPPSSPAPTPPRRHPPLPSPDRAGAGWCVCRGVPLGGAALWWLRVLGAG